MHRCAQAALPQARAAVTDPEQVGGRVEVAVWPGLAARRLSAQLQRATPCAPPCPLRPPGRAAGAAARRHGRAAAPAGRPAAAALRGGAVRVVRRPSRGACTRGCDGGQRRWAAPSGRAYVCARLRPPAPGTASGRCSWTPPRGSCRCGGQGPAAGRDRAPWPWEGCVGRRYLPMCRCDCPHGHGASLPARPTRRPTVGVASSGAGLGARRAQRPSRAAHQRGARPVT
jgi:hypothetical protein